MILLSTPILISITFKMSSGISLRPRKPKNVAVKIQRHKSMRLYLQKMSQVIARRTIGFDEELIDTKFTEFITERERIKSSVLKRLVDKGEFKLPSVIQKERQYLTKHGKSNLLDFEATWIDNTPFNYWTENISKWMCDGSLFRRVQNTYKDRWNHKDGKTHIWIEKKQNEVADKHSIPKDKRLHFDWLLDQLEKEYINKVVLKLILFTVSNLKSDLKFDCEEIKLFSYTPTQCIEFPRFTMNKAEENVIIVLMNEIAKARNVWYYGDNTFFESAVNRLAFFHPEPRYSEEFKSIKEDIPSWFKRGISIRILAERILALLYDTDTIIDAYRKAKVIWETMFPEMIAELKPSDYKFAFVDYMRKMMMFMKDGSWELFKYNTTRENVLEYGTDMTLKSHHVRCVLKWFSCFDGPEIAKGDDDSEGED